MTPKQGSYSKLKIIIKYSTTNTTEQIFKRYNNKYEKGRSSKWYFCRFTFKIKHFYSSINNKYSIFAVPKSQYCKMRQLKITKSITNRESASLDKYLQEIGREDLITVEEEVELAQRIKKGDHAALEKLTRANLRFVVSVAKQYQIKG